MIVINDPAVETDISTEFPNFESQHGITPPTRHIRVKNRERERERERQRQRDRKRKRERETDRERKKEERK